MSHAKQTSISSEAYNWEDHWRFSTMHNQATKLSCQHPTVHDACVCSCGRCLSPELPWWMMTCACAWCQRWWRWPVGCPPPPPPTACSPRSCPPPPPQMSPWGPCPGPAAPAPSLPATAGAPSALCTPLWSLGGQNVRVKLPPCTKTALSQRLPRKHFTTLWIRFWDETHLTAW